MNPLKDSRPRRGRLRRLCVEQIPKDIRLLLAGDHTGWGRTHAKTFGPLSQRGEGEQNPENSCPPLPKGEGLGVRVLETST